KLQKTRSRSGRRPSSCRKAHRASRTGVGDARRLRRIARRDWALGGGAVRHRGVTRWLRAPTHRRGSGRVPRPGRALAKPFAMRRGPTSVPRTIVALGLCLAGACTVPVSTKPARSGHPTTTRVRATERPSPEHASTQEKHGAPTEEPEELYLGGNVDADLDPDVRLRAPGDDAMTPDEPLERNIDADPEVDVFVHPESGVPKSVEAGALPSTPALPVGDPVRVRASDAAREEPALACFR